MPENERAELVSQSDSNPKAARIVTSSVPPENLSADLAADELFAHGLLTHLQRDADAQQQRRVAEVMRHIEIEVSDRGGRGIAGRVFRAWTAAAGIALVGVLVFLGVPGQPTADAVVQASISALRSGGDRRFEVRMLEQNATELPTEPTFVIDTRDGGLMLMRGKTPLGEPVVVGRDAAGPWALRREDGSVVRDRADAAWPRWANMGQETLFADSADRLLEEVTKSFSLRREERSTLTGHGSTLMRRISGTRKPDLAFGPARIDLWIDPTSNLVERMELQWDAPAHLPGPGAEPGQRPPRGGRNGPGGDGIDGPPGERREAEGSERNRREPPEGGDEAGPPDVEGPDMPVPPRPDLDGLAPPDDRRPELEHLGEGGFRPPPRRDGPPEGGPRPPFGHEGPGIGGGRGDHRRMGPPARRPPRLLVMDRVAAPALDDAWFSPAAHEVK